MQDRRPDLASPSESIQQAVIRSSRYGKTHEGFHAPLDLVDGAARVYDPIICGESGCFLKDYSASNWLLGAYAASTSTSVDSEGNTICTMFIGLTAAVALRRASFGRDIRNTFFHAEPTCLTIGPLT